MMVDVFQAGIVFDGEARHISAEGAVGYEIIPTGVDANDPRVYLEMHGGGLFAGGGEACKVSAMRTASIVGARVIAPDYRMPPDHPYPAGLDDCLAFYRLLLRDYDPAQIIVGGMSAGGNLAAALLLRARDEGLPLPAGAVLLTPELDLTESGDSFTTNEGLDPLGRLMPANLLYAAGADFCDPYLSPLFGDLASGFPPTLLASGTRDMFLSNTVRFHRKLRAAAIPAELHVLEAAPHGAFSSTGPEASELNAEVRAFCDRTWTQ